MPTALLRIVLVGAICALPLTALAQPSPDPAPTETPPPSPSPSLTPPLPPTPPAPPSPPDPPQVVYVAEPLADRITFGEDAHVAAGERVHDVITMGGDAVVEGRVTGDVVTMGGDLQLGEGAVVDGQVVTMGGEVQMADGAVIHGGRVDLSDSGMRAHQGGIQIAQGSMGAAELANAARDALSPWDSLGNWIYDALTGAVSFALLFLFGLLLMGLVPKRLTALQAALIKEPIKSVAHGLLAVVATVVAIVVLCITILGIPVAVILAMLAPIAVYVGLVAVASVLGAVLPIKKITDRPIMQLGAGVLVLYLVSLVPVLGGLALAIAACFGIGALVLTRFKEHGATPGTPAPAPSGPYRTAEI